MHRRWADAEVELHVGFGRRPAMQQRIGVDERQILALLGRESFCRRTHAGHPIQLFVRASNQGGADESCATGWSQPCRAHRTQVASERWQAEAEKSARSANPDAVDLTMRGWAMVWQGIQEQSMPEKRAIYDAARPLFEQALVIDPNYADALAGDAMTYMVDYLYAWSPAGTDYEGKDRRSG